MKEFSGKVFHSPPRVGIFITIVEILRDLPGTKRKSMLKAGTDQTDLLTHGFSVMLQP